MKLCVILNWITDSGHKSIDDTTIVIIIVFVIVIMIIVI